VTSRWPALLTSFALILVVGCGGSSTPATPPPSTPTPTPTPLPPLAPFQLQGITHVSWQAEQYVGAQGTSARQELATTGANWAGLLVTWYMPDRNASQISPDPQRSPSADALRASIRHFHNLGLAVMLKPHVDSNDGTWRGSVRPPNVEGWFASYHTFMVAMARIAQDEQVELLCVGTELVQLSTAAYRRQWERVIRDVRDIYAGPLTYAANANATGDEFTAVAFWDLVDLAGLDVYVPLTNLTDPTRDQLMQAWTTNLNGHNMLGAYRNWHASIGRPVIFTEIGYRSADGTNRAPWEWSSSLSYDPGEQEDLYAVAFQVWVPERSWLRGVFWWSWDVPVPSASDTGYTPRNKPAMDVLTTQYGQR
jgi:hypothetical protein